MIEKIKDFWKNHLLISILTITCIAMLMTVAVAYPIVNEPAIDAVYDYLRTEE